MISPTREYGSMWKYYIYAVTLDGELVYQRIFTWDELHDAGWKVVIEPQN